MIVKRLLKLSALGILCMLPSACSVNPATGSVDTVLMSESRENEIGKEMYDKFMKTMPIYQDEKLHKYVEELGKRIAKTSDRPELNYTFTIIDSPDINAFATPGGYIYVNRGLLAYLNSEAELAAVLAHEIAHVTARHSVRQDAAQTGHSALSILTILTTGNAVLADMSSLWGTAAVKGYGREMELEADKFGARYLYRSGYSPNAMLETIGVLKDQEKFNRYRTKQEGKKQRSYHGLFASHPRNDLRLRTVIEEAGNLPTDADTAAAHVDRYRQITEGLVFGVNYQAQKKKEKPKENRYLHEKLGFTLVFPDDWKVENKRSAIVGAPDDKSANIELGVRVLKKPTTPTEYIRSELKIPLLKRSEDFAQFGYKVHTGLVTNPGKPDKRVATFFQGRKVYLFTGTVDQPQDGVDYDKLFMKSIRTFQPARPQRATPKPKTIHYVKANENTTFARLAKTVRLGRYTEQRLRLINGYYPRGEPKPGEWIKIIK